jgi:hypothetical protein
MQAAIFVCAGHVRQLGVVIEKRKGVAGRRGLKQAWSKGADRWTRTG